MDSLTEADVLVEIQRVIDEAALQDQRRPPGAFVTRDLIEIWGWAPGRVHKLIGRLLREDRVEHVYWRDMDILGRNRRVTGFRLVQPDVQ